MLTPEIEKKQIFVERRYDDAYRRKRRDDTKKHPTKQSVVASYLAQIGRFTGETIQQICSGRFTHFCQ